MPLDQQLKLKGAAIRFFRFQLLSKIEIRMKYDVRLEHHAGQPLAVVRRRASQQELARVVPDACGTVWNILRAQRVTGAGRHVAIYWDCQINLEVGVEMAAPFAGPGEVVGSTTPAGSV